MYENVTQILADFKGLSIEDPKTVEEQLKNDVHRVTFFATLDGKRIVFRFYKKDSAWTEARFYNEVSVLNEISNKFSDFEPKVIYSNPDKLTIIESFLDGEQAGDLFEFKSGFINSVDPDSLIEYLVRIKSMKVKLADLPVTVIDSYIERLKFFSEKFKEYSSITNKMTKFFYEKIKNELALGQTFSHADLNAGNIIYKEKQLSGFIDWENACFDSKWKDIASIYSRAYDHPQWQEKFLNKLNLDSDDVEYFLFYQSFCLLNDLANFEDMKANDKLEFYRSGTISKEEIDRLIKRDRSIILNLAVK